MEEKNILTVIEELGAMLDKYKSDIKYKDYEIKQLKNKIQSIESYVDFYTENTTTKTDYQKAVKKVSGG